MKADELWICFKPINNEFSSEEWKDVESVYTIKGFEIGEKVKLLDINKEIHEYIFIAIKRIEKDNIVEMLERQYFLKHFKKYWE